MVRKCFLAFMNAIYLTGLSANSQLPPYRFQIPDRTVYDRSPANQKLATRTQFPYPFDAIGNGTTDALFEGGDLHRRLLYEIKLLGAANRQRKMPRGRQQLAKDVKVEMKRVKKQNFTPPIYRKIPKLIHGEDGQTETPITIAVAKRGNGLNQANFTAPIYRHVPKQIVGETLTAKHFLDQNLDVKYNTNASSASPTPVLPQLAAAHQNRTEIDFLVGENAKPIVYKLMKSDVKITPETENPIGKGLTDAENAGLTIDLPNRNETKAIIDILLKNDGKTDQETDNFKQLVQLMGTGLTIGSTKNAGIDKSSFPASGGRKLESGPEASKLLKLAAMLTAEGESISDDSVTESTSDGLSRNLKSPPHHDHVSGPSSGLDSGVTTKKLKFSETVDLDDMMGNLSDALFLCLTNQTLYGNIFACVQTGISNSLDDILDAEKVIIVPGFSLTRQDGSTRDKSSEENELKLKDIVSIGDWFGTMVDKIGIFLRTYSLDVSLEDLDIDIEERGHHHYRRVFPIVVTTYMIMSTFLIPLGFQFMAMLGGKALVLSKLAFLWSVLGASRRILPYPYPESHHDLHPQSAYYRAAHRKDHVPSPDDGDNHGSAVVAAAWYRKRKNVAPASMTSLSSSLFS